MKYKGTWKKIAIILITVLVLNTIPNNQFCLVTRAAISDNYTCFLQTDQRWAGYEYGKRGGGVTAYIGLIDLGSGCALLSLTNAVYNLTGVFLNPTDLADWSLAHGCRINGVGTKHSFIKQYLDENGSTVGVKLDWESEGTFYTHQDRVKNHLLNGGIAIVNVVGHFACLVAYDAGTDRYLALDSAPSTNRRSTPGGKVWLSPDTLNKDTEKNKWTVNDVHLVSRTGAVIPTPPQPSTTSCGCNDNYAGKYKCTTTSSPLIIRKGHGSGFGKAGSIPSGATVTVTKANGTWAHVIYGANEGYASMQYLKKISDTVTYISIPGEVKHFAGNNVYQDDGTVAPVQEVTPTSVTPDSIVHIDNPHGTYDGSNHIEISGWIVSKYDLTYVMCESDAFGQMNLSGNIEDASAELEGAGYGMYAFRKRFRSVIDRRFLQPNTEYYLKVWAGLSNGATSGVCSQRYNVTSIEPVVINITGPSSSSFTAGKDVTISGTIFSLNPITDAVARLDDINGSSQSVNFDLDLKNGSGSGTYTYGYTFSGTLPLSQVRVNNTTASVFVTAIDHNNIQKTKARTFTIGQVVCGDLGNYQFNFNQDNVRIYASGFQTISGTVYANGPIADVMAAVYHWSGENNNKQVQLMADVQEITPPAGYQYAKSFSLRVSAGDLCNVLDVDSFGDKEFRALLWADLVSNSGQGVHSQANSTQTIFGSNVTRPSYTVSYNANGGSGAPGSGSFKHGAGCTISSTIPSRTGYSFRGWTTSATSNQVKYVPGSSYNTNSSITLYAVWEKAYNIPTDLLSYNFNAPITIKNAPKVYKLVPSATTKYRFTASGSAGANVVIQNASGGAVATFSNASKATKELVLNDQQSYYVVVKPNTANSTGVVSVNIAKSYPITFNASGGENAPSGMYYQYAGEGMTLPSNIPTHAPATITFVFDENGAQAQREYEIEFDEWSNSDFSEYKGWKPGEAIAENRPLVLTAQWKYSILGEIDIPERDGWEFVCWLDEDGNLVNEENFAIENATYYAQWTPAVPLEGITVSPEKLNLAPGNSAMLSATQIPENAFDPAVIWDNSNPEVVSVTTDGKVTALSKGVSIVTAISVENDDFRDNAVVVVGNGTFSVKYDANGGESAPENLTVAYGESFTIPEDTPVRNGYSFAGWAFTNDTDEAEFQPGDILTVDRDRTLYAVWRPDSFTISFDANGGEEIHESQIKKYDEPLILSDVIPVREGFGFAGWATDPSSSRAEYPAGGVFEENQETVLYAVWLEHAEGISLNYSTLALRTGERKELRASVTPEGAAGTAVKWTSSDNSIVTVKNGMVTAVSAGEAVISCTVSESAGITASCRVRVASQTPMEGILDVPVSLEYAATKGRTIKLSLRFVSGDAAYAKILYSYDETALELVSVTSDGEHVTIGNKAVVLAVSGGKIPDGEQAELTFRIRDNAEFGSYRVDTAVVECYTINEEDTNVFAATCDGVKVGCDQHTTEMIAPTPATKDNNGLSVGWKCSVCGETLTDQMIINKKNCFWLPEQLTTVEDGAFEGIFAQQIVLSENVTSIGDGAFKNCPNLLLIVIPASVTEIGEDILEGCEDVYIITPEGSQAETYAIENDIALVH